MRDEVICSDRSKQRRKFGRLLVLISLLFSMFVDSKLVLAKQTSQRGNNKPGEQVQSFVHVTIAPVDEEQKDSEGKPSIVPGHMRAFVLDQKTGQSYEGATPFLVGLPAIGTFSITLRAPSEEEAPKNPAFAYMDGFKSNVQMAPTMEGQMITIPVKKKPNRSTIGVVVTGPVQTPLPLPAPAPVLPAPTPSFVLPPGKALVLVGVDSSKLVPTEDVKCLLGGTLGNRYAERELDCALFFSSRGIQLPAGKTSLVVKSSMYTIKEEIELQAGQVKSIRLKLPGRLKIEGKEGKISQVTVQIDKGPAAENVSLPFSTDLESGATPKQVYIKKEGYSPLVSWAVIEPLTTTTLPVTLTADPVSQAFLCGHCGKSRGQGMMTTEISVGTPDWFLAQFLIGAVDLHKNFKLDLGVRISTSYYLTVAGAVAQAQFINTGRVALAAQAFIGGGGGPNGALNKITFELGPIFSVDITNRVQFYLHPYFQTYQDILPTFSDRGNPSLASPIKDPLGYRFILQGGFEFNLSRFVNLSCSLSWAPGTSRFMYSSGYGPLIYPESDNIAAGGLYGKVSLIIKWPPFRKKI